VGVALALLASFAGLAVIADSSDTVRRAVLLPRLIASRAVHVWAFGYRAHNGSERSAYLVVPAWYRARHDPRLPLIISPHGRGVSGRANVRLWGDLPALGRFAVLSPDGEGGYSWGDPGQISDLAKMPSLAQEALPWLRVEAHHVYAFGGSMGGQETLLLLAQHPRLLAGAAAFDSVADFGYQYREFPLLSCNRRCLRAWREPLGWALQDIARKEIGGTPTSNPRGYARRSPLDYVHQIALSHVPLELWWSRNDLIVRNQREQSGELFREIRQINPKAAIEGFVGSWAHTAEMRSTARLPFALAELGLLPARFDRRSRRADYSSRPGSWPKVGPRAVD
jgi:pimeloyl-ACP methyl ester carboxylesterase